MEYVIAIDELADFAYQDLAEIYFKQGNFSKALQILKDYHNIGQPDEELFFLEGQCHEAMENYKMARYCYRKALHIYPAFHEVFFKIGETYEKEDAWENALKAFTKAELGSSGSRIPPRNSGSFLCLGFYEETLTAAQDSLDIKLNNSRAYILMIKAHLDMGKIKLAWVALNRGKELCKDCSELMPAESALLFIEGKRKAALLTLENALEINADFAEILFYFLPELEIDPIIFNMVAERKSRP
ncbi:MAG: tetratricopeptide repeat protein [Bacteroidetes bacterium]|nr:tetratricopeptide repeat protein [Bacteroidota bacterium]